MQGYSLDCLRVRDLGEVNTLVEHILTLIFFVYLFTVSFKEEATDFPGGPVVKTPCFHCGGHGFDPWLGN